MTLVNAKAAIETAINTAVTAADNTVSVVFDNMPFTTPGKTKKYVMVTINFDQVNDPSLMAQRLINTLERCNAAFLRQETRVVLQLLRLQSQLLMA